MRVPFSCALMLPLLVAGCEGKLAPSPSSELVDPSAARAGGSTPGGSSRGSIGDRAAAGTIAEVNTELVAITVDDETIYTIDKFGGIFAISKSGGAMQTLRDSTDAYEYPGGLVVDDGFLYWSVLGFSDADGKILRMPKQGGAVETVAEHQARPHGIAVDASHVFWTNEGVYGPIGTDPTGGAVVSAPKAGGEAAILAEATTAYTLALDDTNVYFATLPWGERGARIGRLPKAGGSTTILADGRSVIPTLVVDQQQVVWTEGSALAAAMPIDGGPITQIFAAEEAPEVSSGLAAANGIAFFGNGRPAGSLLAATSAGDSHVLSQVDLTHDRLVVAFVAVAIAVDATQVYWVDTWATYDEPVQHATIRAAAR